MDRLRARLPAALAVSGGAGLMLSLFLIWSHQIPVSEHRIFRGAALFGVPSAPTAWQVYAITAEVLGALAVTIAAAGLGGRRPSRIAALVGVLLAVAFVIHALSVPPTNGLLLTTGTGARAHYISDPATAGPGETVALVALLVAGVGLGLSLASPPGPFPRRA